MDKKVVTRFAPSPTGDPHIGSLRTALYGWLYARQHGGKFLLRIEDTDRKRYKEGADVEIMEMMKWTGLDYDGEVIYQSSRREIHHEYALQLVKSEHAYYCFCSSERLAEMREAQQKNGEAPHYDGACRQLSAETISRRLLSREPHVIRFKMPEEGETKVNDLVRGEVVFKNAELDDLIIFKSDGFPTYHLAVVVDDYNFNVTHVTRTEEWLPSAPLHIKIYEAFGWPEPKFAHLPLVLAPDKSKLSKRHGTVSVLKFREEGYLPEALLNFVLLLGWHPKQGSEQEIFSVKEMIEAFDLTDVQKAGAVFDRGKLDWLNGVYIRQTPTEKLVELAKPYFDKYKVGARDAYPLDKAIELEQERIKTLSELPAKLKFVFEEIDYDSEILIWPKSDRETTKARLLWLTDYLERVPEENWTRSTLEDSIKEAIEKNKFGLGDTLWPLRVALTGQKASPGPFEVAEVLGKEQSLARLKRALAKLE